MRDTKKKTSKTKPAERKAVMVWLDQGLVEQFDRVNLRRYGVGGKRGIVIRDLITAHVAANQEVTDFSR